MSVILKEGDEIILLTKGADSIIEKRLAKGQEEDVKDALQALEDYGKEGLRTLMLAQKLIDQEDFNKWEEEYKKALTCMTNREQMIEEQQDLIEVNLDFVGCTAIEDKLQDEVPETIDLLLKANIKLWVLTGDKGSLISNSVETAMTIAMSCKLIDAFTEVLVIDSDDHTKLISQLDMFKEKVTKDKKHPYSLFVVGDSLIKITEFELQDKLIEIADCCDSFVIYHS